MTLKPRKPEFRWDPQFNFYMLINPIDLVRLRWVPPYNMFLLIEQRENQTSGCGDTAATHPASTGLRQVLSSSRCVQGTYNHKQGQKNIHITL